MMKTLTIAAAAIAMCAATPAAADPLVVRHADLDLASPAGRAALDRRIARAVEAACGSYFQTSTEEQWDIAACRAGAFAHVRPIKDALVARATGGGSAKVASR
jgi:UrcA family protein